MDIFLYFVGSVRWTYAAAGDFLELNSPQVQRHHFPNSMSYAISNITMCFSLIACEIDLYLLSPSNHPFSTILRLHQH